MVSMEVLLVHAYMYVHTNTYPPTHLVATEGTPCHIVPLHRHTKPLRHSREVPGVDRSVPNGQLHHHSLILHDCPIGQSGDCHMSYRIKWC